MSNTETQNTVHEESETFKNTKRSNDRTCILTGESKSRNTMIRLVQGPDGSLVPDLAEKLPGRGIWISANRAILDNSIASGKFKKAISRSLKAAFKEDVSDLSGLIERLLTKRCLDRLGLEQRAGNVVTGFDKIKTESAGKSAKNIIGYLTATDSGDDGRNKLGAAMPAGVMVSSLFNRDELSNALGKDNAVHVIVFNSGGAKILIAELDRLQNYQASAN
jgi:predicted RNA-binding protein YlxR (DUF448 family)